MPANLAWNDPNLTIKLNNRLKGNDTNEPMKKFTKNK